jgi:hypothetical protein
LSGNRILRLLPAIAAACWTPAVSGAEDVVGPFTEASALLLPSLSAGTSASHLAAISPGAQAIAPSFDSAADASNTRVTASGRWYQDVDVRTRVFLTASVLAVATYGGIKWWSSGFTRDFRTQTEGWFGEGTPKGGADKLGHAFGTYTGVRAGAHALELIGNSRDDALKLATATSLAIFTGIELLDGFSKNYKFSKEDAIANAAGAGLGWVLQKYPQLDALADFRLYYRQSPEAKAEGKWEPFADYNGQKYLLVFKASGVPRLDAHPVLRYLELAFGYGVRGYDPPGTVRSRHLYAGVALNVSRVLDDTVFRDRRESLLRKETGLFLELFQLPGTVVLANHKL